MRDFIYPKEWDIYTKGIWRQVKQPRKDIKDEEVVALRQDLNIVAQHIVAIRNELNDKMKILVDTNDEVEQTIKRILEKIIDKINDLECKVNESDLSKLCVEFGITKDDK